MAARACASSAIPVFEGLVLWDLTRADKLADIRPGLAESWEQDKNDKTKWIFHLRKGVKFHDGSDFNADAAIWNLDRYFKQDAPQFDPPGGAVHAGAQSLCRQLSQDRRLHDRDRQPAPAQLLPEHAHLHALLEPGAVREDRVVGRVRQVAVGHGPVQDHRVQAAGQRRRWRATSGYWDKDRVPKLDKMVLFPMPEATTRLAALRSGQVDWIEVPPPDAVPSLKSGRLRDRHRQLSAYRGRGCSTSPRTTRPGRTCACASAINYCLNRDGLVTLLNGLAEPSRRRSSSKADPLFRQPEGAVQATIRPRPRRC